MSERNEGVKAGMRVAISRLEALRDELDAKASRTIWETGKGDFIEAGYVLGAKECIAALERLLEKENV